MATAIKTCQTHIDTHIFSYTSTDTLSLIQFLSFLLTHSSHLPAAYVPPLSAYSQCNSFHNAILFTHACLCTKQFHSCLLMYNTFPSLTRCLCTKHSLTLHNPSRYTHWKKTILVKHIFILNIYS